MVVAGTGSNAISRSNAGEIFGAGGWGPVLGDEGSGTWIGLEAIRAALRGHDREDLRGLDHDQSANDAASLLRGIERHWKLDSLGELVACATGAETPTALRRILHRLHPWWRDWPMRASRWPLRSLAQAGIELAELVALIYRKMKAATHVEAKEFGAINVAFTGSVLTHIAQVRTAMTARLTVLLPEAHVRQTSVDPLDGASRRARQG